RRVRKGQIARRVLRVLAPQEAIEINAGGLLRVGGIFVASRLLGGRRLDIFIRGNEKASLAVGTLAGPPFQAGGAVELVAIRAEEDENLPARYQVLAAPHRWRDGRAGGGHCCRIDPELVGLWNDKRLVALGAFARLAGQVIGSVEGMAVGTMELDH